MKNTIGEEASNDGTEIQGHPKAGQANGKLILCVKVWNTSLVQKETTIKRTDKTSIEPGQV